MKYLVCILWCLVSQWLYAQDSSGVKVVNSRAIRFNALGLVDPLDGNISFGGEYALNTSWSLTTDISYIFYSGYIPDNQSTSGFIVKPAARYYTSKKQNRFLEVVAFYKQADYRMEDWLGMDVVDGVPSYDQFQKFIYRKRVAGASVQGGLQGSLSKNKLLRLEVYAGLGVRFRWQGIKDEPRARYQPSFIMFNRIIESYTVSPNIPFGVRLSYYLR